MTGSGTLLDPYVIWDVVDLQNVNLDKTAYYELGQDIDASATVGWNLGAGFIPLGTHGGVGPFTGHFDGKGYEITKLFIYRPAAFYIGLFGAAEGGATISNVGLVNCDITGARTTGGLVGHNGFMVGTSISNCYTSGAVKAEGGAWLGNLGGLVGLNRVDSTLTNCHSSANIIVDGSLSPSDTAEIGGLVGENNGEVIGSYATGNVNVIDLAPDMSRGIGGLVGQNQGATSLISKSYSTGSVTVNSNKADMIGGFVGRNRANTTISNCYARGDVDITAIDPTSHQEGGFVGYNAGEITNSYSTGLITTSAIVTDVGGFCGNNADTITDCFWDTQTSGQATSDGGIGRTTAEMKASSTFIGAGWGFGTFWGMTGPCNDGYPCLLGITPSCAWAPVIPSIVIPSVMTLAATGVT